MQPVFLLFPFLSADRIRAITAEWAWDGQHGGQWDAEKPELQGVAVNIGRAVMHDVAVVRRIQFHELYAIKKQVVMHANQN